MSYYSYVCGNNNVKIKSIKTMDNNRMDRP